MIGAALAFSSAARRSVSSADEHRAAGQCHEGSNEVRCMKRKAGLTRPRLTPLRELASIAAPVGRTIVPALPAGHTFSLVALERESMASIEVTAQAPAVAISPVIVVGSGAFTYRVEDGWGRLPDGWQFKDVAAVGVDGDDRVYVFNRGAHPMIVFDRAGNFLRSWGEGTFARPHGLHIALDDCLYCTDDGDHTVRKCTPEGKVLLTIGMPGKPAPYFSGEPFHRCTHHRTFAERRHLRFRWLPQRAGTQVRRGWAAPHVMG
jgi:hypothetical protein